MKRMLLIICLVLLLLFSRRISPVMAVNPGDSCSTQGSSSDCGSGCCGCSGITHSWYVMDPNQSCSELDASLGTAKEGIYNPAIKSVFGSGEGAVIVAQLIANFLKIAFSVAGLILLTMLLWGGIEWMTAAGNQEKLAKAQKRVTNALIGFVIFMSVFAVTNFLAPALGLEFLQILKINWPTP